MAVFTATRVKTGLGAADRLALRVAIGATLGFAIALALGWRFSFLVPMLAVQILAASPAAPGLRQGLTIPIVILVSTNAALAVASILADAPLVQLMVIGLVLLWSFYGQRRGAPGVLVLLVQIAFCAVPLFSTVGLDLGHEMADFLQRSSIGAIVTVWVSHALVPAPPQEAAAPAKLAGLAPAHAAKVAISDTLALTPLVAWFMIEAQTSNLVILIATINLLREVQPSAVSRTASGLMLGNVFGGVAAVLVQQFVFLADTLATFLLTVFASVLWFASRMARGGPAAPLFSLALGTFLLLLGLAITPLPGGSGESYVVRIVKICAASLYALGAVSLAARLRRA